MTSEGFGGMAWRYGIWWKLKGNILTYNRELHKIKKRNNHGALMEYLKVNCEFPDTGIFAPILTVHTSKYWSIIY